MPQGKKDSSLEQMKKDGWDMSDVEAAQQQPTPSPSPAQVTGGAPPPVAPPGMSAGDFLKTSFPSVFGDQATGVVPGIVRGIKSFDPRNIAPPNPPMSPTDEQIAGVGTAIQHVSEHPIAFAAGQIPVIGPMIQNFMERFKTDPHGAASELATQLAIPGAAYGITGAMDAIPGAVKSGATGLPSVLRNMAESGIVRGGLRSIVGELSKEPAAPTPPPSEIAPPITPRPKAAPTNPTAGEQPSITTSQAGPGIQVSGGKLHFNVRDAVTGKFRAATDAEKAQVGVGLPYQAQTSAAPPPAPTKPPVPRVPSK